jgi:hypothetical protein
MVEESGNSEDYFRESFVIPPKEYLRVYHNSHIGSVHQYSACPTKADSIHVNVFNDSVKMVDVDLNKGDNWNYNVSEKGFKGGGTCYCSVYIANENIK